jgi:hypothetical protein
MSKAKNRNETTEVGSQRSEINTEAKTSLEQNEAGMSGEKTGEIQNTKMLRSQSHNQRSEIGCQRPEVGERENKAESGNQPSEVINGDLAG